MAKQGGLGARFYLGGSDLSGDINSLGKISGSQAQLDVTDITQSAHSRLFGLRDGGLDFVSFFDTATGAAHPVLSALPTADVITTFVAPVIAIGTPAACMVSKQVDYNPTRQADGMLTFAVSCIANADGMEWGLMLTSGMRTDTGAANGTSYDSGGGFSTPAVPASGTPVTNTSPLPATVVVSGGTGTNVAVNGIAQGTFDGTYTVPAGGTISLTYTVAPTWAWVLQTAFGAQAYLHVSAFAGTDVTVTIQDSADNSSFANVTGLSFAQVTGGVPLAQRIATSNTATIRRYLRAITTTSGGFTSVTFAVVINRNPIAGFVT